MNELFWASQQDSPRQMLHLKAQLHFYFTPQQMAIQIFGNTTISLKEFSPIPLHFYSYLSRTYSPLGREDLQLLEITGKIDVWVMYHLVSGSWFLHICLWLSLAYEVLQVERRFSNKKQVQSLLSQALRYKMCLKTKHVHTGSQNK